MTLAFLTLGFCQLWHVFNMRGADSTFFNNDVVRNPHVWGALILCSLLLVATVWVPLMRELLKVTVPTAAGWGLVIGMSLVPWAVGQLTHGVRGLWRVRGVSA